MNLSRLSGIQVEGYSAGTQISGDRDRRLGVRRDHSQAHLIDIIASFPSPNIILSKNIGEIPFNI